MGDEREITIKEAFALNHSDGKDFFKTLALGIVFGSELKKSILQAGNPRAVEGIVREKMMAKVGKEIPGVKGEVFTEDMCNAIIGLFGKYGHLFLNF